MTPELLPIPRTLRDRALLHLSASRDLEYRKLVVASCRDRVDGPVFFINAFAWGLDPRKVEGQEVPLFLYDYQENLVRRLMKARAEGDDLWIDKSRDMGGTWTIILFNLEEWLFAPGWHSLLGSNKEQRVDDRTPDSHFGKIDYTLERLPSWFMAAVLPGFNPRKHRQKLKLVNPSNAFPGCRGNTITGESSNPNFGRGPRKSHIFFDEAASFDKFDEAWMSASQTTRNRVALSTPNGMSNAFGRMIHLPENQPRRITLHWRLHPLHDQAWYEAECARLVVPEHIAQELDISYQKSTRGLIYPVWEQCTFGVYEYDPNATLFCSIDAGLDMTAMIWWQRDPVSGEETMLDCYQATNRELAWFQPFAAGTVGEEQAGFAHEYSSRELAKIAAHAGWKRPIYYGDPSLNQRDVSTKRSPADRLRELGINVFCPNTNEFLARRRGVLEGLRGLRVNLPGPDSPVGCHEVDDAMRLARYQARTEDSQASTEPIPVHDGTSHFRSAVEYYFLCRPPFRRNPRPEPVKREMAYSRMFTGRR